MLQRRLSGVFLKLLRRSVSEYFAFPQDQQVRADLFHYFQNVRAVEDSFSVFSQCFDQVPDDEGGTHIQSGKGLIEYQNFGIVE